MSGFLRAPSLSEHHLAVISGDSLWLADRDGGEARLLSGDGDRVGACCLSKDGSRVAYASSVEGIPQAYVQSTEGGEAERWTHEGRSCVPVGWRSGGRLVVRSSRRSAFPHETFLEELEGPGAPLRTVPVGPALTLDVAADDDTVLVGRQRASLHAWKGYRGGWAGEVWIGSLQGGGFRRLGDPEVGPVQPCFAAGRVWFLMDPGGVSRLHSCEPSGEDLREHGEASDFGIRSLTSWGDDLVFARAGRVVRYDAVADVEREIDLRMRRAPRGTRRRFVTGDDEFSAVCASGDGDRVAVTVRGCTTLLEPWGEFARRLPLLEGDAHRLGCFLAKAPEKGESEAAETSSKDSEPAVGESTDGESTDSGEGDSHDSEGSVKDPQDAQADESAPDSPYRFVGLRSRERDEWLEHHVLGDEPTVERVELPGVGRIHGMVPSPASPVVALTDVEGRLLTLEWSESGEVRIRERFRGEHGALEEVAWSRDGRYLAFVDPLEGSPIGGTVRVLDLRDGRCETIHDDEHPSHSPSFDPKGRFLFVLSERTWNPLVDGARLQASCPRATRIYAYTTRPEIPSPFEPRWPTWAKADDKRHGDGEDGEGKGSPRSVEFVFEGVESRVIEVPDVPATVASRVRACDGGVLYLRHPLKGLLDDEGFNLDGDAGRLWHLAFETGKCTSIHEEVLEFEVLEKKTWIRTGEGMRLLKTGEEPGERSDRGGHNPQNAWVDLERAVVEVHPRAEWKRLLGEAWRLQRDHFWRADLGGVDWNGVWDRYSPWVERITTRSELSEVIDEMQGELRTSHAYEWGGVEAEGESYPVGLLGADLEWEDGAWRVKRILEGDPWDTELRSPLLDPGVDVRVGDRILGVGDEPLGADRSPGRALLHRADQRVELTLARGEGEDLERRRVWVRTLSGESGLRYRDRIRANRRWVREHSGGKLGYLHIPDMGGEGLAEFFRAFRAESRFQGIVVDVRHNGGGWISPVVLDALARRAVGFDVPRHGAPVVWPPESVRGPLVALCDGFTGSDGDMFCYGFRRMGLGPLVGTRTWGGVVGIDPNQVLADGTVVTQPEYAIWFDDLGYGVENHGIEPDVEIVATPEDLAGGRDPQLERAVSLALEALAERPALEPPPPPGR